MGIYENIQKWVKNSKLPNNFSVNSVKDAVDNILMSVRISFFQYVASIIAPFMKFFHSDKLLSSFLYRELEKIIYSLLQKFIKPEVLAVYKSVFKMMKRDLNANRVHYKNVKIGIAATSLLNKLKASEGIKIKFRRECLDFFVKVVHNLQERCPLKYKLTRTVSSLISKFDLSKAQLAKKRTTELLTILHEATFIGVSTSNPADLQFQELCILATGAPEFDFYKKRMDDIYVTILGEKPKYKELFNVAKLVCILSHRNATAGSGFSIRWLS